MRTHLLKISREEAIKELIIESRRKVNVLRLNHYKPMSVADFMANEKAIEAELVKIQTYKEQLNEIQF